MVFATSWLNRRTAMSDEESQGDGLGSSSFLTDFLPSEPLVTNEEGGDIKHVHWSASTTSLTGLAGLSFRDEEPLESGNRGEYRKNIVYGGLDSIVTSFALVASISGYGIGSGPVLVLGFATLVANAMFTGFGHYSKAEQKYVPFDEMVTDWDVQNDLHAQAMTLVHQCELNGMDSSDATEVRKIFAEYKDLLEEQRMKEEDGLGSPDDEDEAWKNGLIRIVSFLGFGSTPLLSFVVVSLFTENNYIQFLGVCLVTSVALIILGLTKAKVSGEKLLNSTAAVWFKGAIAGVAAYGISWCIANGLGIE